MSSQEKQPLHNPPPYSADAHPPPQPGYQPQPATFPGAARQQTANVTTVVTQPVVLQQKLGEHPVTVTCPTGGHQVTTEIHYESGTMVWVVALVIFLFLGICFAWIPFVINDLKDVVHTCPIDGTVIGVYKRL